jgi:hypothetical protein
MYRSSPVDATAVSGGVVSAGWLSLVDVGSLEALAALIVGALSIVLLLIRIGISWREWRNLN